MNQIKSIERANEAELALGISAEASWHAEFAHSPYIYTGGLPYELNEGDILVVFSQCVQFKLSILLVTRKRDSRVLLTIFVIFCPSLLL